MLASKYVASLVHTVYIRPISTREEDERKKARRGGENNGRERRKAEEESRRKEGTTLDSWGRDQNESCSTTRTPARQPACQPVKVSPAVTHENANLSLLERRERMRFFIVLSI